MPSSASASRGSRQHQRGPNRFATDRPRPAPGEPIPVKTAFRAPRPRHPLLALLHEPLVQFLLLGALIFLLDALLGEAEPERTERTIVLDAADVTRLSEQFRRTWMRPPTPAELDGLLPGWNGPRRGTSPRPMAASPPPLRSPCHRATGAARSAPVTACTCCAWPKSTRAA